MLGLKYASERARRGWRYATSSALMAAGLSGVFTVFRVISDLNEKLYGVPDLKAQWVPFAVIFGVFAFGFGVAIMAITSTRYETEEKVYRDIERGIRH